MQTCGHLLSPPATSLRLSAVRPVSVVVAVIFVSLLVGSGGGVLYMMILHFISMLEMRSILSIRDETLYRI